MAVIAKFESRGFTTDESYYAGNKHKRHVVKMGPVYPDDANPENRVFWKWTPSGECVLEAKDAEQIRKFSPGKQWYIRFYTPNEAAELNVTGHRFRVRKLANESDDGDKKLYMVEIRPVGDEFYGGRIELGTINEEAAKCFLGWGEIIVTFEEAVVLP